MASLLIFMICLYVFSTLQIVILIALFKGDNKITEVTKNIYHRTRDKIVDNSDNVEYVSDDYEYERERGMM